MELKKEVINIAKNAQEASRVLSGLSSETKNKVLKEMAFALVHKKDFILKANRKDIQNAVKKHLAKSFIDRLTLSDKRIKAMADSLLELTKLVDPVGEVMKAWRRPNGLWIHKVRTPIGVIAIIYESRPNVTSDCVGLCFKSGNSVILRGGREALNSNLAIYGILKKVINDSGIPENAINMVTSKNRRAVDILLKLNNYIDCLF